MKMDLSMARIYITEQPTGREGEMEQMDPIICPTKYC